MIFSQVAVVLIGIIVLGLLLWEPHLEGRNVNATFHGIYFKDPFLLYVYVAFIPFFIGLYQLFRLIENNKQNNKFSWHSLRAVRIIKYCAVTSAALFLGALVFISMFQRSREDDVAGGVAVSLFLVLISSAVAVASRYFEKCLRESL